MMKQKKIESIIKIVPDILKEASNYLKETSNGVLKSISSNTGTIGLIVKIFGQPLIDKHFKKVQENRLKNYGLYTYLEASLIHVGNCINTSIPNLKREYSVEGLITGFERTLKTYSEYMETVDNVLFFQPKYHPIVTHVFFIVEQFLKEIEVDQASIIQCKQKYYDDIDVQIANSFGPELYAKHLREIKKYLLKENEIKLLNDNVQLGKIGFKQNESLSYEETYAEWKPVSSLYISADDKEWEAKRLEVEEKRLSKIESLIEEYFNQDHKISIEKILFIVADFGKGKSVFLKHYTSLLSKKYIYDSSEYFPIYFNLRNFKDFQEEHPFGILGNYLEIRYGIRINDEYFINKRYLFLIDSLDESGDLNPYNIDKVIASVKKIQNLNPGIAKFNRIIISTRPFDDGLKKHLEAHKPFVELNSEKRPIEYFISLYGFRKDQFNNWLSTSLKNNFPNNILQVEGLNKEILDSIRSDEFYNFHDTFLKRKILSNNELRRPIFAYMIFQLISNAIEFEKAGKIGVYLSFLNLLTKEAKYVHDISYKINLAEQFEARNILHSTAAVWLYNRSSWNKSEIKKADICRALEGEFTFENDTEILNRYRETGLAEIQFLSHSYFGENNNTLHFQHQSFAEILIAEYYLKIIIKYALDEEFDFESARIKLSIGTPTNQTISFFRELLGLFRESIGDIDNSIEKRRLLFPLLASLATKTSNKILYSNYLYYTWFSKIKFDNNSSDIPRQAFLEWPITVEHLDKISDLSRKILNADNTLSIQTGEFKTSLFNKEVFSTKINRPVSNIDKLIALLCGNLIFNNEKKQKWFNSTLINPYKLFQLIIDLERTYFPDWIRTFFLGIDNSKSTFFTDLSGLKLNSINFSHSKLKGIIFNRANLYNANFSYTELTYCDFGMAFLNDVDFKNAKISHYSKFSLSILRQGVSFPYVLANKARAKKNKKDLFEDTDLKMHFSGILVNYGSNLTYIKGFNKESAEELGTYMGDILKDGYDKKIWTENEITAAFKFSNSELQITFHQKLLEALNSE